MLTLCITRSLCLWFVWEDQRCRRTSRRRRLLPQLPLPWRNRCRRRWRRPKWPSSYAPLFHVLWSWPGRSTAPTEPERRWSPKDIKHNRKLDRKSELLRNWRTWQASSRPFERSEATVEQGSARPCPLPRVLEEHGRKETKHLPTCPLKPIHQKYHRVTKRSTDELQITSNVCVACLPLFFLCTGCKWLMFFACRGCVSLRWTRQCVGGALFVIPLPVNQNYRLLYIPVINTLLC